MANKNSTEISLMKGVSVKLDADTILTLGYFVHTEPKARDKSDYVYSGRIDKISDIEAEITEMNLDEHKLEKWTWKGLPNYEAVVYDDFDTKSRGAKWLKTRLNKVVDWETFVKVIDGWKASKNTFNANAKYVSTDYIADDGTKIENLKEAKDILLSKVGQTITHRCLLKNQI